MHTRPNYTVMRFDHFYFTWGWTSHCWKFKGVIWNKKCSPEKVSINWHLQIDTFYTQNFEFFYHELTCSRPDQAKVVFWQMQKFKISNSKIKSHMLIKSTVLNFLNIFQLIQKVLMSNFKYLVLNIPKWLYKNYKILF